MYKAIRFDSIFDLAKFLNASGILQSDIIFIGERFAANGYGIIELLYIDRIYEE